MAERDVARLRDRSVEVRDVVPDGGEVHPLEGVSALPRLDAGDAEQRVECRQHLIGFPERSLGEGCRGGVTARVAKLLEAGAQPAQRSAQVVGDVVRDSAHIVHQCLDTLKHGIQVRDQLVEFVAAPVALDALRQLALHDAARCSVDGLDARNHASAQSPGDDEGEHCGNADAPSHGAEYGRAHLLEIPHVASDQEVKPAPELEVPGPRPVRLAAFALAGGVQLELHPEVRAPRLGGPSAQVAREHSEFPIGEQVDRRAGGVAARSAHGRGRVGPAVPRRGSVRPVPEPRLRLPPPSAGPRIVRPRRR